MHALALVLMEDVFKRSDKILKKKGRKRVRALQCRKE